MRPFINILLFIPAFFICVFNIYAQTYNVRDLGSFLGANSYAYGINNDGKVVGCWSGTNGARAFLYDSGAIIDLGGLGATNRYALSINSAGNVVGFADDTNGFRAFLRVDGTTTNLGPLGGLNSYAYGINDQGQIVGNIDTEYGSRAFLYNAGFVMELGTLGGTNSFAFGINNSTSIVGSSLTLGDATHAFLWRSGSLNNLNDLAGTNSGWELKDARGINNAGHIVGWGFYNSVEQAFLYRTGQVTQVGVLPGAVSSYAFGINNSNQIVGGSALSNGTSRAFLWNNGHLTNLNDLIPPGFGWDLREARGINDRGQIVGWGVTNGQEHAFILSPNTWPTVAITNPSNNAILVMPVNITLRASAADADGEVSSVEFFQGTTSLGLDLNAPFSVPWNNVGEGTYLLKAIAKDESSATTTSSVVSVTVVAPAEILTQPASQRITTGSNATFSVVASGTAPLSYQWKFNGNNITGATTSSYSITNVQTAHSGSYTVTVSNSVAVVTSANAVLTVAPNPRNLGKGDWIYVLSDATNKLGGNVPSVTDIPSLMNYERLQGMQFIVVKAGDGGTVWTQFNSNLVYQAHAAGLKIFGYGHVFGTNVTGEIAVATNVLGLGADGFVIDAEIEYESQNLANNSTVAEQYCQGIRTAYPDAFLAHSPFVYISQHSSFPYVTFGKYCDVVMPQCYWRSFNKTPAQMVSDLQSQWNTWQNSLTGSNTNAIKPIVPIAQGWSPSASNTTTGAEIVEFVNRLRTNTSPASVGGYKGVSFWRADLHSPDMWQGISGTTIGNPEGTPVITRQPQSLVVNVGDNATFTVNASGAPTLKYQWRLNGSSIAGATGSSYTRTNVQSSHTGVYSVTVSNAVGVVLSGDATLNLQSISPWLETFESGLSSWKVAASTATALTNSNVSNHTVSGTNGAKAFDISNRMFRNIGSELQGNSKVTFWMYDSTMTRAYGEVRAYTGSGYTNGTLQQFFAIGRYGSAFGTGTGTLTSETVDTTKYQGRVFAGSNTGWFNLNATGTPNRSTGWHEFAIERLLDGTTINFYVDGILGRSISNCTAATWDSVSIGSIGSSSGASDAWFDDVKVEYFGTPIITTQPASQTVNAGYTGFFTVETSGTVTSYQWRRDGTNIAGATTSSLTINSVTAANAGDYTVVVRNSVGATVSSPATLTVITPPSIIAHPQQQTVSAGTPVTFKVVASGTAPFAYQWKLDGNNIPGATSDELSIASASQNDAGSYSVAVANSAGVVVSSPAMLIIDGSVIFSDRFENGLSNWVTVPTGTALEWATDKSNPVTGSGTAYENNSLDKMYHNLGTEAQGRVRATFWIYDDSVSIKRAFGEVRSFTEAGYASGSLQQIFAIGIYRSVFDVNTGTLATEQMDPTKYQARVYAGVNSGWFNLNAPGAPSRSAGWHRFEIVRSTDGTAVHFYVDGILCRTVSEATAATWDTVLMGSYGAGSGEEYSDAWFDDIKVETLNQVIVTQPATQTKNQGEPVTFSVVAMGTTPTYQWKKNGVNISGATASSYTIANVQASHAADYTVLVISATDTESSSIARLAVIVPPTITAQPVSVTKNQAENATFSVTATGTNPAYQWKKDGVAISGATTSTLTLSNVTASDQAGYTVIVSNAAGSVISSMVALTVIVPPTITQQPDSVTKNQGETAIFMVIASGGNLSYQWKKNNLAISGATTSTLQIENVTEGDEADYAVSITNAAGAITSSGAILTVIVPPSIISQPTSEAVCRGSLVILSVYASGSTLAYQWKRDGIALTNNTLFSGVASSSLTISNISERDLGSYQVEVSNAAGTAVSDLAAITFQSTLAIDIDIDSDNNDFLQLPGRTVAEENIESSLGVAGKYVAVNNLDTDKDGVPDFADGFDTFGNGDTNGSAAFTPLILQVSSSTASNATVKFSYSASNPNGVTRTNDSGSGYSYTCPPGRLRIWTRDGKFSRLSAELKDGGDFIASDVAYSLQDLGLTNGVSRAVLYVEAVASYGGTADVVSVETSVPGLLSCVRGDAIRLTVDTDTDRDGLVNAWENSLGTDGNEVDTDLDGRTDKEEVKDGTNPLDNSSVKPVRLALWNFDRATNYVFHFTTDTAEGQTNSYLAEPVNEVTNSWDHWSIGLTVPRSNSPVDIGLAYEMFRTPDKPNITPKRGTVSLWIRPNWSSTDAVVPNDQSRFSLFHLSQRGNNSPNSELNRAYWGLECNSNGTELAFCTTGYDLNAPKVKHISSPINWSKNTNCEFQRWRNVVLEYCEAGFALFIDGTLVATNSSTALAAWPGTSLPSNPWQIWIGGRLGTSLVNGSFDNIETFNCLLSPQDVAEKYSNVADRDSDHDGLKDLDELELGLNHLNFDTDGDKLPDGWEVKYSLDPKRANGDENPDADDEVNVREFLFGTNPNVSDKFIPSLPYDVIGSTNNKADIINLDFGDGNKNPVIGPAAAGVDSSDFWTIVPRHQMVHINLTNASGAAEPVISLGNVFGPVKIAYFERNCDVPQSLCQFLDGKSCSHSDCTPTLSYLSENSYSRAWDWQRSADGQLVVANQCSQLRHALLMAFSTPETRHVAPWTYFLRAFDFPASMNPVGQTVSAHPMFVDFALTTYRDEERLYSPSLGPIDCGKFLELKYTGRASVSFYNLPGRYYRMYIYCNDGKNSGRTKISLREGLTRVPSDNWREPYGNLDPQWGWTSSSRNSKHDAVYIPNSGQLLNRFVNGVNYARIVARPHEKTISLSWDTAPIINGLQLVELKPLASPEIHVNTAVGAGVVLTWAAVPTALEYEIYRKTNSATAPLSKIATTKDFYFQDPNLVAGTYAYQVKAKNEIFESISAVTNVSVTALIEGDNYAPILNYVRPIKQAFAGWPFTIGASMIGKAANAFDVEGAPLQFVVTEIVSGSVEWLSNGYDPESLTNTNLLSDLNLAQPRLRILNSENSMKWTPDRGVEGDVVAFRVRAFDGVSLSAAEADVYVSVKPETMLYGWGNYSDGMSGSGVQNSLLNSPKVEDRIKGAFEETLNETFVGRGDGRVPLANSSGYNPVPQAIKLAPEVLAAASNSPMLPVVNGTLRNIICLQPGADGSTWVAYRGARAALTSDGSVWVWGLGTFGQMGDGVTSGLLGAALSNYPWFTTQQPSPVRVNSISNVVSLAASAKTLLVAKSDGTVWGWGETASRGQTQEDDDRYKAESVLPLTGMHFSPVPYRNAAEFEQVRNYAQSFATNSPGKLPGLENIVQVAVGEDDWTAAALTADGKVYVWGRAVKILANIQEFKPQLVDLDERIIHVACGASHWMALTASGKVYVWGFGAHGSTATHVFGDNFQGNTLVPHVVPYFANGGATQIATRGANCLALREDGRVVQWGRLGDQNSPPGMVIVQDIPLPRLVPDLREIKFIDAAPRGAYAVDALGQLWSWGYNEHGVLGLPLDGRYGLSSSQNCSHCPTGSFVQYRWNPNYISTPVVVGGISDAEIAGISRENGFATSVTPRAPYGLAAQPADHQVTLSWKNFPLATSYKVWRNESKLGQYVELTSVIPDTSLDRQSFVDAGVENYKDYYYKVSVEISGTNECSEAVRCTPQPPPQTPTNLVAISKARQVTLGWSGKSDADVFYIYRNSISNAATAQLIVVVENNIRVDAGRPIEYTDGFMKPGQTFFYWIKAANLAGESDFSNGAIGSTISGGPNAPTDLTATASDASVTLTWQQVSNATQNTFYVIRTARAKCDSENHFSPAESQQSLNFDIVDVIQAKTNVVDQAYLVDGLLNGRCYAFSVSAIDFTGEGSESQRVTARPGGSYNPAIATIDRYGGPGSIYVRWSCDAESFRVYLKQGTNAVPFCGSSGGKLVYPDDTGVAEFWLTGLNPGQYSVDIIPTMDDDGVLGSVRTVTDIEVTSAISSPIRPLLAVPASNRVDLSWWGSTEYDQASALGKFQDWRFLLMRKEAFTTNVTDFPCDAYSVIGASGGLVFSDTDVQNGHTYSYRLVGVSPLHEVFERDLGITLEDNFVTPSNVFQNASLTFTSATAYNGAVNLSWTGNNVPSATEIQLLVGVGQQQSFVVLGEVTGAIAFRHDTVENGTTYYYKLRGRYANGDVIESAVVSATPSTTSPLPPITTFVGALESPKFTVKWADVKGAGKYIIRRWDTTNSQYSAFQTVTRPEFSDALDSNPSAVYRYEIFASASGVAGQATEIRVQPLFWSWPPSPDPGYTPVRFVVQRKCGANDWTTIAETENLRFVDVQIECCAIGGSYQILPVLGTEGNFGGAFAPESVTSESPGLDLPPDSINRSSSIASVELLDLSTSSSAPVTFTTPTNLTLRANVGLKSSGSSIERVDLYANGNMIGTVASYPYDFSWVSPAGALAGKAYTIVARAVDSNGGVSDSPHYYVKIEAVPQLKAFTTASTDIQLPAPGLHLAFTRTYDSQEDRESLLGKGWMTSFERARMLVPIDLNQNWEIRRAVLSSQPYNIQEKKSHGVSVTLPDGSTQVFQLLPAVDAKSANSILQGVSFAWLLDDALDGEYKMPFHFAPVQTSVGELRETSGDGVLQINANDDSAGEDIALLSGGDRMDIILTKPGGSQFSPNSFFYTGPDGSVYEYGSPREMTVDDETFKELSLLSVADRNGNKITYSKTFVGNQRLFTMAHSNGRTLQLAEQKYATYTNFNLYDSTAPFPGGTPVLTYKFETGLLKEVGHLRARTNMPTYDLTTYEYFTSAPSAKVDNLLKRVISPEGLITLENDYFGSVTGDSTNYAKFLGFLRSQTNAVGVSANIHHDSTEDRDGNFATDLSQSVPGGSTNSGSTTFNSSGELVSVRNEAGDTSNLGYDGQGRLSYTEDGSGSMTTYTYDTEDRPVSVTDELGNTTQVQYGPYDQPTETTDAMGRKTRFDYYPNGALRLQIDPSDVATEFTYNLHGQVLTEKRVAPGLGAPIFTSYEYYGANESGGREGDLKVTKEALWSGHSMNGNAGSKLYTTEYTYDANGNRLTETRYRTVIQRDSSGNVTSTNALQAITTTFIYDAGNRMVSSTMTATTTGATETLQTSTTKYNDAGKVSETTDTYGRQTKMTYDVSGNLIETLYPDQSVTRTVYDGRGRAVWQQERSTPSGTQTTAPATSTEYDAAGRVIKVRRFAAVILDRVAAQAVGESATITDAALQYRRVSTSSIGQVRMVVASAPATNSFATITRTAYDSAGRVKYSMDTVGTVTAYDYDGVGRRIRVKVYAGAIAMEDRDRIESIEPGGQPNTTEYSYDANGNQTRVKDALNRETDFVYDISNRRIKTWFPFVQGETIRHSVSTVYDALGRRIREVDEAGVSTAFGYDALGRLACVTNDWKMSYSTDEVAVVTSYLYDESGNMISQRDARGNTTLFEYDALGRRTHRILPGGELVDVETNTALERVTYSIQTNGTLLTLKKDVRDFRGKTISFHFDINDRLTTKVLPTINTNETGTTVSYFYDASSGGQVDHVTMSGDVNRTTYYAYDNLRKLTRKDTPEGVLVYTYTSNGAVETIKGYRRGDVATNQGPASATPDVYLGYNYDKLGRLTSVTNNKIAAPNVTTYFYDEVGNLDHYVYPNGVEHRYTYTEQNRLRNLTVKDDTGKLLRGYAYDLSLSGQRTGVTETIDVSGSPVQRRKVAYEYDKNYGTLVVTVPRLNRLTSETIFDGFNNVVGNIKHAYDRVGNRTSRTVNLTEPDEPMPNQWLAFDQRDLIDNNSIATDANPNYDLSGNSIADESGTATGDLYDAENHLIKRGSDVAVEYDHDGNRAWKIANNVSVYYLLDDRNPSGYVQVLAEYNNTDYAPVRSYNYGHDLVSETLSTGPIYYGYDGHGSVRTLLDTSADEVGSYDYDAYGKLLKSTGTVLNSYRYTGEQWDEDLEMYFLRARFYRPEVGRFWTSDSFNGRREEPSSLHKYLYCYGDPINRRDCSGLDPNLGTQTVTVGGAQTFVGNFGGAIARANLSIILRMPQIIRGLSLISVVADVAVVGAHFAPEAIQGFAQASKAINRAFAENTTTISAGWGTRGFQVENIAGDAIKSMGGDYLGGNVKGIDGTLFVGPGDVLFQVKSHDLSEESLKTTVRNEMRALRDLKLDEIQGMTVDGVNYNRPPGPNAGRGLIVAVPESQARYIISPSFIRFIEEVAEETKTFPIISTLRQFTSRRK